MPNVVNERGQVVNEQYEYPYIHFQAQGHNNYSAELDEDSMFHYALQYRSRSEIDTNTKFVSLTESPNHYTEIQRYMREAEGQEDTAEQSILIENGQGSNNITHIRTDSVSEVIHFNSHSGDFFI